MCEYLYIHTLYLNSITLWLLFIYITVPVKCYLLGVGRLKRTDHSDDYRVNDRTKLTRRWKCFCFAGC